MKSVGIASRRLFLQQAGALAATGVAAPFALNLAAAGSVAAQTALDYKALVCIFLSGGNDSYNTVLATDDASWVNYTKVRTQAPNTIALLRNAAPLPSAIQGSPQFLGGVLPITPATAVAGRSFALHPKLLQTQDLFGNRKRLAIVSNVGTLMEPLTKDDYNKGVKRRPLTIGSHNDQSSAWQALSAEGATMGWGGRLADAFASSNANATFTALSTDGNAVWLSGQSVRQYSISTSGALTMGTTRDKWGVKRIQGSDKLAARLERVVSQTSSQQVMAGDIADTAGRSIAAEQALASALPSALVAPFGPDSALMYKRLDGQTVFNSLAQQLQIVARIIAARGQLGAKRQVFFVSLGGFDTHIAQSPAHADLMLRLDHGLQYFDAAMTALGVSDQVTTFTASDFGRQFCSDGYGTGHGWGAHHFVMGGAVAGGNIYGKFPVLGAMNTTDAGFDSSPDQLVAGSLLPRIAVDQYGATLGRWYGLSDTQLKEIFPNLGNFSETNLGFMKV